MKSLLFCCIFLPVLTAARLPAQDTAPAPQVFAWMGKALDFLNGLGAVGNWHGKGELKSVSGLDPGLKGSRFELWLQPPSRVKLSVQAMDRTVTVCQDGPHCWIHVPGRQLLIKGDPAVPRFSTRPDSVKPAQLNLLRLPVSRTQLMLLPALLAASSRTLTDGSLEITMQPSPSAAALDLPMKAPKLVVAVAPEEQFPHEIRYSDSTRQLTVILSGDQLDAPLPEVTWQPSPAAEDKVEKVATAHLERFFSVSLSSFGSRIPTLPPATGSRWLIRQEGDGRLEDHDGTRVLFLSGTPLEMGRQQGVLLKSEIRRVVDRILYGVGVGSSFEKGRWFFGEIEEAVRRMGPFIEPAHLQEMDAIAEAAGLEAEEVRLANFFPELFHCSGFALSGKATAGGRLYHGRILDYLRGAGLEENAVVIVNQPAGKNAWVNISYAGFTGSVTAMNEKQLSLGEMGGKGEGQWDGKPMAQLVREVMENCSTIDQALEFMRRTPRTCEYYYVLADAKSNRAAGIKATPDVFEIVWAGQSHQQLPDQVPDTVLLSAGSRYEELVKRVKAGYGTFDAPAAIQLMTPPVCMKSNIHSVLFVPDTLDFYVANADSRNVASETRYTAYNLRQLLTGPPAPAKLDKP